jgi:hypothetical protein
VGKDDRVYEILDDTADIDAVQEVREAARARPTSVWGGEVLFQDAAAHALLT